MQTDVCASFFTAVSYKHLDTATPVIALEGQSYAGKSTTLATLQQAGYGGIREYSEYKVSASLNHLVPPPDEQTKDNFLHYLHIEQRRYQEYLKIKDMYPMIFLDRSIFTLLAYRFARGIPADIFAWVMETVLDTSSLLYPHHILYVDLPLSLVKQRHQRAGDRLPAYFMHELFYERFRSFFLVLQTSIPTRITIIDGSQDPLSTLREIYQAVQARGLLKSV